MSKNDDWVTVRISAYDKSELELLAQKEERTLNGMIRLAIRNLLDSRKAAA